MLKRNALWPSTRIPLPGTGRVAPIDRVSRHRSTLQVSLLLLSGLLLWGCTGSDEPHDNDAMSIQTADVAKPIPPQVRERIVAIAAEPSDLNSVDINDGQGSQQLNVAKLLRQVGVLKLLSEYIINIPPSAESIAGWEANKASIASSHHFAQSDTEDQMKHQFEKRILGAAQSAMDSLPSTNTQALHDAFFEVLEQCGRDSPWPEVELFEMYDGRSYDIMEHLIGPTFGMSYFEYQQLRHECARYATTYPKLEPTTRDKLLAQQRTHYAMIVLDRLDNKLPLVQIPAEYQAQVDELRRNGW